MTSRWLGPSFNALLNALRVRTNVNHLRKLYVEPPPPLVIAGETGRWLIERWRIVADSPSGIRVQARQVLAVVNVRGRTRDVDLAEVRLAEDEAAE